MSFIPNTLYYASAAIHAISIPGHIIFGINEVDPAIAAIPSDSEHALGKATATTAWDMVNALLAASGRPSRIIISMRPSLLLTFDSFLALLNIQWARVTVRTTEEKLIVWTTVVAGAFVGWRYFKHRAYAGLGCLWFAPWMTLSAMIYRQGVKL